MIRWELVDAQWARAHWNDRLAALAGANPYQSFEWGEYRTALTGRPALRWVARDVTGAIVAMFQGTLLKRVGRTPVITSLGGPVGDVGRVLPGFAPGILQTLAVSHGYVTIGPRCEVRSGDVASLDADGWRATDRTERAPLSMMLDLSGGEEAVLAGASGNWRHNLKRSGKRNLIVERWLAPDPAEVVALLEEMESIKGIGPAFSVAELTALFAAFGDRVLLWRARDASGSTLSVRGCLVAGPAALDFIAATNAAGRRVYASYATTWALLTDCIAQGIKRYDLNEIDPVANPGVYDFKKGTGASAFEYLGPWEWASSETLRMILGGARRLRRFGSLVTAGLRT